MRVRKICNICKGPVIAYLYAHRCVRLQRGLPVLPSQQIHVYLGKMSSYDGRMMSRSNAMDSGYSALVCNQASQGLLCVDPYPIVALHS